GSDEIRPKPGGPAMGVIVAIWNSIVWCLTALWDFILWFFPAIWWFIKWLPQRLLGLTDEKLPVGATVAKGFDYVRDGASVFLDGFADATEAVIDVILALLLRPAGVNWMRGRSF